jgi:hypothetical protein
MFPTLGWDCGAHMNNIRSALLGTLILALTTASAFAEKRVALVIGNSAYKNVARLANPANDAATLAEMFKKARFDVVESRIDLSAAEMRRALRDFADKARDADIAVVYYAGHGIEVDGTNYLIPVDAQLERDTDVYDETFALDRILVAIEPAKQLRLIILDACRDNPFTKTMKRTIGSRSVGRGLAKVEPASPNTMIAFATKAGFTASDGDSKNSPYAAALAKHLTTPGLDLRRALGFVRDDVMSVTSQKQEPFTYGSLGGNDLPLVAAVAVAVPVAGPGPGPAPAPVLDKISEQRRDYEFSLQVGTREAWDYFIGSYPTGFYSDLAKAQRNKLAAEEVRLAATEKAKVALEEQARLVTEGARATVQAKAAADVKAAELDRVAAENKKKLEEAKVAAESAKVTANRSPVDKPDDKPVGPIATLVPSDKPSQPNVVAVADIPRQLQAELRRVGCNAGAVDGNWNAAAQRSLELFNRNAGMKLDVKVASLDALDAVRGKTTRICPLICGHGYKTDGERCIKISCRAGWAVGDDNTCERIEVKKRERPERMDRPVARRERDERPARPAAAPSRSAQCSDATSSSSDGGVNSGNPRHFIRREACLKGL